MEKVVDNVVFSYHRIGFLFVVYTNRVTIHDGVYQALAKRTNIPIKNISSVDVVGLSRKLEIKTNDSKVYQYNLGTKSTEALEKISSLL